MKRILIVTSILCEAALFSYGASWNAKLLDASCAASATATQKQSSEKFAQTCAPTAATTSFAIEDHGKVYKLDAAGNEMAAAAIKNASLKPDKDGDFHVAVNGAAQGDTIRVDSVSGVGEHKTR